MVLGWKVYIFGYEIKLCLYCTFVSAVLFNINSIKSCSDKAMTVNHKDKNVFNEEQKPLNIHYEYKIKLTL